MIPPHKSMTMTPVTFVSFRRLGNAFWEDLLHHLPWQQGQAHQHLLSWIFLPDLPQHKRAMSSLPDIRICSQAP